MKIGHQMWKTGNQHDEAMMLVRSHERSSDWESYNVLFIPASRLTIAQLFNPSESLLDAFRGADWSDGGWIPM